MRSEIKSDNLILRKYEIKFAPLLFEAAMESRGGEFSRWMPWCHENYAISDSESFIEKIEESWQTAKQLGFAIFDTQTNDFLGGIGLNQPNDIHKFYNLGYWIRPSKQNCGIASKATRILAQTGFEDLPINRIEILTAVENIPSQKAAQKIRRDARRRFAKTACYQRKNPRRGDVFICQRRFSIKFISKILTDLLFTLLFCKKFITFLPSVKRCEE